MIVLLRSGDPALLERLSAVRSAGDIPLVGDDRWARAQWRAVRAAAAAAQPPAGTAWATLTSGSSGAPRIVLRSEESWAASYAAVAGYLGVERGDAVALPLPASSSLTLFSLAHALAAGLRPAVGAAAAGSAAALHATPQALRAALETPAASVPLRSALVGGSHLDPALRSRAAAAGVRLTAYYGAAELSFVAVDSGDGLRAFPGVDLDLRDGTLWVRSPFLASGYAGAPGPLRRDGAWATVGDRAESSGGRLRLLGRADDAILSASATIVPEEVEAVLRTAPGVRDAVAFGLPSGPIGALVAALVEPESGQDIELSALRAVAAAELATAHRPRRWFAGALPRSASGKPARAEAARRARDGEVRSLG
ncbi:O-succinylbenzoate-CoA ligase [Leifsonia xyli subsp. cynodontis DSM 46306]|uniref:O-succinylbenzoate--CoA ligase n=1 Tax=Leifsonia xyli subsp. cynodontis DSM 46306 TaxID=1389489 RepID=U3P544_LEIXC|nr:class I adenylate-forming enzyme family protein [Leifsonia xyli]AGW40589.1 O-succinylbenzoate-CoA ligase [Leifsonia xyli subsp. cynodontis DSM 46306]